MRAIYETKPQTGLAVAAGGSKVFPIQLPPRTRITRINVIQEDTTHLEAFTITLFNYPVPDSPAANKSDELYRFSDEAITSDSAGYMVHFFTEFDTYFYSQEPDISQGTKARTCYVRIRNPGSYNHSYRLIIATEDFSD